MMNEVSSRQSRSRLYIHAYCCCCCECLSEHCRFSPFWYVDTACCFTTEYLDLIDICCNTVRFGTTYEYALVYPCLVLLLLPLLLLAAAVRHRVLDGKVCSRGPLHLIPVFSFSSFKHDIFLMYPLAVLSRFQGRFFHLLQYMSYILDYAEPRRALACRGVASLVWYSVCLLYTSPSPRD